MKPVVYWPSHLLKFLSVSPTAPGTEQGVPLSDGSHFFTYILSFMMTTLWKPLCITRLYFSAQKSLCFQPCLYGCALDFWPSETQLATVARTFRDSANSSQVAGGPQPVSTQPHRCLSCSHATFPHRGCLDSVDKSEMTPCLRNFHLDQIVLLWEKRIH